MTDDNDGKIVDLGGKRDARDDAELKREVDAIPDEALASSAAKKRAEPEMAAAARNVVDFESKREAREIEAIDREVENDFYCIAYDLSEEARDLFILTTLTQDNLGLTRGKDLSNVQLAEAIRRQAREVRAPMSSARPRPVVAYPHGPHLEKGSAIRPRAPAPAYGIPSRSTPSSARPFSAPSR